MTAIAIIVVFLAVGVCLVAFANGWIELLGMALILYSGVWFGRYTGLFEGLMVSPTFGFSLGSVGG